MFRRSTYQHPETGPFSSGTWSEVGYSWLAAITIVAAVLAMI